MVFAFSSLNKFSVDKLQVADTMTRSSVGTMITLHFTRHVFDWGFQRIKIVYLKVVFLINTINWHNLPNLNVSYHYVLNKYKQYIKI